MFANLSPICVNCDVDGENGSADKYRCGVLSLMIQAKLDTNLI